MGLMETEFLRRRLDKAELDNQSRPANAARDDLFKIAHFVEREARHLQFPAIILRAMVTRAAILRDAQRLDEAIALLEDARHELGSEPDVIDRRIFLLGRLAEAYALVADWQNCSTICGEGIQLAEELRRGDRPCPRYSDDAFFESAYLRFRIGLYAYGALAAFHLGDMALLLIRAELSKCRPALRYGADVGDTAPTFSLAAVQAMLDEDEAVCYYYWVDHRSLLLITLDREQVVPELRSVSDSQRNRLDEFADFVLNYGQDSNPGYLAKAWQFSKLLLPSGAVKVSGGETAPPALQVLQEKRRLLISPHRLLHAIPFHVLRWQGELLIQRFAVTYTPNLTNLLHSFTPCTPRHVLAIGIRDFQSLNRLPKAKQEVLDLKRLCQQQNVPFESPSNEKESGEWLRHQAKNGTLRRFSCLHFATHGENIKNNAPLDSHLSLFDALLSGREIAEWRLAASMVVLSACSSGQRPIVGRGSDDLPGEELPGDDLFGLHAAFFEAGARWILSCLWPVDDEVAPRVTLGFHRAVLENSSPPEIALQAAVIDYLKTADKEDYSWAPFFLSTLGRPTTVTPNQRSCTKEMDHGPD
jgi:hypothetical protein